MKRMECVLSILATLASGCGWETINPGRDCRFVPCSPAPDAAVVDTVAADVMTARPDADGAVVARDAAEDTAEASVMVDVIPAIDAVDVTDVAVIADVSATDVVSADRPVAIPDVGTPDTGSRDRALMVRDLMPGDVFGCYADDMDPRLAYVYYLARNWRRYYVPRMRREMWGWGDVFPVEQTLLTWYPNMDHVRIVPRCADIADIPIGGNVTFRPGTYLGRIATDPKIYAITTPNVLHWIETERLGVELYGSAWRESRVVIIPDAFFVNYSVGRSINTPRHPDGTLIRYDPSPGSAAEWWETTYLIQGGQRRRFASEAAFFANRYQRRFVAQTTIAYPDGLPITGYEYALAEPIVILDREVH